MIIFFQAEDGIRVLVRSRGLGDVYKRQGVNGPVTRPAAPAVWSMTATDGRDRPTAAATGIALSLIHI